MLSPLTTPMARPSALPIAPRLTVGVSVSARQLSRRATSATLTAPFQGVGVDAADTHSNIVAFPRDAAVAPAKPAPALATAALEGPSSSGYDFIDLIGLDERDVLSRLQDAVTYRVLVGGAAAPMREVVAPAATGAFNVKQLKSFRDNVTRNCAPTVASGFAAAAKAAGHVLGQRPTSPQQRPTSPQQNRSPQPQKPQQPPAPQQLSLRQRLLAEQQQRRPGTPAAALALAAHSHHRSKQQGQQQQVVGNPVEHAHADGRASVLFALPHPVASAKSRALAAASVQAAAVAAEAQWALPPAQPAQAAAAAVAAAAAADKPVARDDALGAELRQAAAASAIRAAACAEAAAVVARRRRGSRGAGLAGLASAGRQPGGPGAAWI